MPEAPKMSPLNKSRTEAATPMRAPPSNPETKECMIRLLKEEEEEELF